MKFITILICLFSAFLLSARGSLAGCFHPDKSNVHYVALIYNGGIPSEAYHLYDWIITDPGNPSIKALKKKFYLKHHAKLIAYVSFGESAHSVPYYKKVRKYLIGGNKIWSTRVLDIRKSSYRRFLLSSVLPELAKEGFDGFMFDTMDSYKLAAVRGDWPLYRKAEVEFIKSVRKKFPGKLIVVNRCFSIMGKIHGDINGVVAESLYRGLNGRLDYDIVPAADGKRLISMLDLIKNKYGLPVIVVDYVNPVHGKEAGADAQRISEDGFIPWVTDKDLSVIGKSALRFVKRRIMIICNPRSDASMRNPNVVRMPLEYLGFVPQTFYVNGNLPKGFLADRYAGAVIKVGKVNNPKRFYDWVKRAISHGLKVFFINSFGFPETPQFMGGLGISTSDDKGVKDSNKPERVYYEATGAGFEVPLVLEYEYTMLDPSGSRKLVVTRNGYGQESVPFAITPWGGYAMDNSLVNYRDLWVYNPFTIFDMIFKKGGFPVPDVTTENGRIMLFSQVDGDADFGHTDFDPNAFIVSYVSKHILERYKIPVTLSVITADLMNEPYGLHVKNAAKLRKIFREVFKHKNVEIASHTFSHPFSWPTLVAGVDKPGCRLPVKHYKFSIRQEVDGSVDWINRQLAPGGKTTRVLLWSGDCLPPEKAMAMTYSMGIYNVNGDDTKITNDDPFLKEIKPMGKNVGDYFQVNAAVTNEEAYTNLWRGPFWGFRNVIQTFKLTEAPRRIKPVYIYYHWYSGQKLASVSALKTVYNWAMKQHPIPEFVSQYAKKVLDFRSTAVGILNGGWLVRNSGNLRTLRAPVGMGYPDMKRSKGVVGYRVAGGLEYISLDNSGNYLVYFNKNRPAFRLVEANGMVSFFKKSGDTYTLALETDPYVPLHFSIEAKDCRMDISGKGKYSETQKKDIFNYRFKNAEKAYIKASCY